MSKVTLLLCALLIAAMISQGSGCEPSPDTALSPLNRQGSFNYTEMVDSIKHPGLISALMVYDTDKDGIISGEGQWEI